MQAPIIQPAVASIDASSILFVVRLPVPDLSIFEEKLTVSIDKGVAIG